MIEPSTIEAGAAPPAIRTEPGLPSDAPTPAHEGSHTDPPAITVDRAVWAKVKGFPWWPARVQEVSGQTITVFFFGTEQLGKVRAGPSSCVPFSARPAGAVVAAGKRGISGHDSFVEAVAQAQAYDVRAGLGLTRGGSGHVEVVAVECEEDVEGSGEKGIEVTVEEVVQEAGEAVAAGVSGEAAGRAAAAAKKGAEGQRRKRPSCPFTSAPPKKKSKKSKKCAPAMSSEEAQLIASIRAGKQEYHHQGFGPDGEAYYELEDVDDEPFRDECDECGANPSPSQRWYKSCPV